MPLFTGTLTLDEMGAPDAAAVTLAQIREDRALAALTNALDTHNRLVAEQLAECCEITTDVQRPDAAYGEIGEMVPLTETGRAPTQISTDTPVNVGFPLEGWQYAIGWTQRALDRATANKIARQTTNALEAHVRKLQARLKQAFYRPTNYSTRDYLSENKINLDVKAFYNGDGAPIPMGPNGEVFPSTHSHYLVGPLDGARAAALIGTVREHSNGAEVRVVIALDDEAAWRALPNFTPYLEAGILRGPGNRTDGTLDVANPANRPIGKVNGAEVWVKPWAIGGYPIAYDLNGPRPLALRVSPVTGVAGGAVRSPALRLASENRAYPLIAQFMEAEFGFGAQRRGAAAILYTGAAAGQPYVVPAVSGNNIF
jgi:hypothetical protein